MKLVFWALLTTLKLPCEAEKPKPIFFFGPGYYTVIFQVGVFQAFSSSPTGESTSPDPWADRTAELTFGAGAESKPDRELNLEEAQAKLSRIAAAEASSSDEEEEQEDMAPPDRMEVDNDQDRKWLRKLESSLC